MNKKSPGKIECIVCHKRCRGSVLKISNNHIHKSCFKCTKCRKELQEEKFHLKNQLLYCPDDYRSEFSVKCTGCGKPAEGDVIIALEKTFHTSCLHCHICLRPLTAGEKTIFLENDFYCSSCAACKLRQLTSLSDVKTKDPEPHTPTPTPPPERNGHWQPISQPAFHESHLPLPRKENSDKILDSSTSSLAITGECLTAGLSNGIGELTVRVDEGDIPCVDSPFGRKQDQISSEQPMHGYTMPANYFASSNKEGVLTTPSFAQTISGGTYTSLYASSRRIFPPGVDYGRNYPISYLQLAAKGLTAVTNVEDMRSRTISSNIFDKLCSLDSSPETSHRLPPVMPTYAHTPITQRMSRRDMAQNVSPFIKPAHGIQLSEPPTSNSELFTTAGYRNATSSLMSGRPERDRYSRYRQISPGSVSADRARSTSCRMTLPLPNRSQTYSSYSIPNAHKRGMRVLAESMRASAREPRSPSPEAVFFTAQARKLASYPGAQIPDANSLPVIDRYDWPAPPSPAVVMLDRRREREIEQDQLLNDVDDGTSPRSETLLSNASTISLQQMRAMSPDEAAELERLNEKISTLKRSTGNSGMSSAVVQYLEDEKRKCESIKNLDPVSASRSPSANQEPPYRTRYTNHRFASPSRSNTQEIRRYRTSDRTMSSSATGLLGGSVCAPKPGYTSGLLSSRTVSLPRPVNDFLNGWSNDSRHPYSHVAPSQRKVYTHGPFHDSHALSSNMDFSQNGLPSSPGLSIEGLDATESMNAVASTFRTQSATLTGGLPPPSISGLRSIHQPSYVPSVDTQQGFSIGSVSSRHCPRTVSETGHTSSRSVGSTVRTGYSEIDRRYPAVQSYLRPAFSLPSKQEPLRTYRYEDLKVSSGIQLKGVHDRHREEFLSPNDFERLFEMSITSFRRLPEWKRNDIKRRLDLF